MVQLDFIVMAVFAVLIFAIGLAFTRTGSKSSQAFFEAGGETPWWINGLSLFISYFSAGTFVVWGSIAYKHGLVANTIQLTMAISGLIVAVFIAARWKRTGTRTAAEYIGLRFGTRAQQFYTYLILILSLVNTSAVLYPVGKMVYVATPFSLEACIIGIGILIVLYTAAGGLWAVLVTDVVQFIILMAAVLIVIPASFAQIGGVSNLFRQAPADFFEPFANDYTAGFMLAFIGYQTVYIGGNWSYVQRYTSVSSERNAKKVAYLFAFLYALSPVIWMLPPMIYRIINPDLHGLEPEGAYMMLCQRVLPAGLIGLVLSGMISATSSKANTTINLSATVFAQDVYRSVFRPGASEKEQILVARLFTLLFGAGTIGVALLVPLAGGIVEVVLSVAAIAGGALFAPIIWSLYSSRQTAFSVVFTTIVALVVSLSFKVLLPAFAGFKLDRSVETLLGVGLPLAVLGIFEYYYYTQGMKSPRALALQQATTREAPAVQKIHHEAAQQQNRFGITVIIAAAAFVGAGIALLGVLASSNMTVVAVGSVIFLLAGTALYRYVLRA
ncbi:sodium:solute symporter family protein [Parachryseolinea silvisoli]|uniref:sodium:solute symporter family protein n=1 Tax=Parachryseolinea silvisoli TaxID=2873601 RepID=UPI002265ECE8|nr:sodium:solute symporter family protein [Parachryseolinea silvisoli]MCD9015988.1 Na+:solute symporter [Parachryseolinea silvisoli]